MRRRGERLKVGTARRRTDSILEFANAGLGIAGCPGRRKLRSVRSHRSFVRDYRPGRRREIGRGLDVPAVFKVVSNEVARGNCRLIESALDCGEALQIL